MTTKQTRLGKLTIKSKVWVVDESGKVVFGAGRLRILELVDQYGSIHAAAKELRMSYRAVWGKIKATEDRLGQPLVKRKPDGARRGGSVLTPFARVIMEMFRQMQTLVEKEADDLFQNAFSKGLAQQAPPKTAERN
jgi:molybdate transport system regulatory protein